MADNYTALKSSQKKRYISKETFNSLDLSQIPVGSEYEVVSPIEKGDLSADINNALNKAENALPKPTNDTTGSAGQVLKKTANGSEWGDAPSGGGKLYRHQLSIRNYSTNYYAEVTIYSSKNARITNYNEFISYAPLYFNLTNDSTAIMFEGTVYIAASGDMSGFLLSKPTVTDISAAEPIKGYAIESPFEVFFTAADNEYNDTVTEL